MGDFPANDGGVAATERTVMPPCKSPANSSAQVIDQGWWARAEKAAQNIIFKVHPTAVSEQKRREVIDYMQRLIGNSLGAEVFPYGSVPLKTYLPDGDIDLSAFGWENPEDLRHVIEGEVGNRAGRFRVKDVLIINAEVKIVKCLVENIVVDISFNQIGGLSTLCFLEKVDCLVGKDHLYKRSVILIKAWCYYESRILGAHHGLISTYALETMVLYIFNLFHSTLNGPLAVLYKFLDYFSKFDWENYCISLNGPVRISSSPAIVAEKPVEGGSNFLLSDDFLRSCADDLSVPSRHVDRNPHGFQKKHLNIIDPLKETNNLGRSVSRGNLYRIHSALSYGARQLGGILVQREDNILSELHNFFSNIVERHGSGQSRPLQNPDMSSSCNGLSRSDITGCEISPKVDTQKIQASVDVIPRPMFAPHHFFLNSNLPKNENLDSHLSEKKVHSEASLKFDKRFDKGKTVKEGEIEAINGNSEHLLDLDGDYNSFFYYLECGRWHFEHASGGPYLPMRPLPPTRYGNKNGVNRSYQLMQNSLSQWHPYGFIESRAPHAVKPLPLPATVHGFEELPKPRGLGTYFPNMSQPPCDYRPSMDARNQAMLRPNTTPRRDQIGFH